MRKSTGMRLEISGVKRIGHALKSLLPISVFTRILAIYHYGRKVWDIPYVIMARRNVRQRVNEIKCHDRPIRFGFYVILDSAFQLRRVFELMLDDGRFDPFIVVVPRIGYMSGDMQETVNKTYDSLVKDFGSERVFKGYESGVFHNHIEHCDACALMNLYAESVAQPFEVKHFACNGIPIFGSAYFYINGTVHIPVYYGMASLRYVYRFFCSNELERDIFIKRQGISHRSKVPEVTGCSKSDNIVSTNDREREKSSITVLITPHHSVIPTVDSGFKISNFLKYKNFYLDLPKKYPNIQWILRPHPLLPMRLIKDCGWSKEEWESYADKFNSFPNAQYESGGTYYNSFECSDAIINDCGSFLPEYFYTGKPHCYMFDSVASKDEQFDEWGHELIEHTYQAFCEADIVKFIENVVIGGNDTMRDKRIKFAKERVMINYPHASETIVESIAESLGRGKKK